MVWPKLLEQIRSIPQGQFWRHNQVGDLVPASDQLIDSNSLRELVNANTGKLGFTYTHYPVEGDSDIARLNRECVKFANENGFTINLSADSLAHADRLLLLNIGPVATVLPSNMVTKSFITPAGNKGIVCPVAIDNPKITSCSVCKLCAKAKRNFIIGFPAHGAKKKTIDKILEV